MYRQTYRFTVSAALAALAISQAQAAALAYAVASVISVAPEPGFDHGGTRTGDRRIAASGSRIERSGLRRVASVHNPPRPDKASHANPPASDARAFVAVSPATVSPGDRLTLSVRYRVPMARADLEKRARAVVLYGPAPGMARKYGLDPLGGNSYRLSGALPPGRYRVGYAWSGTSSQDRFVATTPLTVRPALSVSVTPDPAQGRNLRLTISNHAVRPLTATATVDMLGNRTDTISSIVLAKGQSLTLPITNAQPVDRPLSAPLPVIATVSAGANRASWSGNVYFWAAGKSWGPPLALESAQQWQGVDGGWDGPEDLSAIVRARYDERNLYLRADVTDDRFSQPYALGEMWKGDSLQIAVDPTWSRRPDTRAVSEFGLAETGGGPQVFLWNGATGDLPGAVLRVSRDDRVTHYEASIPWRSLGVSSVRPGRALGFSLLLNDNDGGERQGGLMYGDGITGLKRADRYGTLTLLPSPTLASPAARP